jgi:hypothetical protein
VNGLACGNVMASVTEHDEQVVFVEYVRYRYPRIAEYLFAVPNAAKRSYRLARRLSREGLSPGYPDIGIDWPINGWHGLRIEMKRRRGPRGGGATPSDDQTAWVIRLNAAGYCADVCYGADEAIERLERYLHPAIDREKEKAAMRVLCKAGVRGA